MHMNNFEMAIFALAMSLSPGAQAADGTEDSIRIDRSTTPNAAGDCSGKTGSDKAMCDKELFNDRATDRSNENSRLNRNRDIQMRDDINSNNTNMRDNADAQARDNRSRNMKRNDMNRSGPRANDPNATNPSADPMTPNSSSTGNTGAGTGTGSVGTGSGSTEAGSSSSRM